MTRDAVLSAWLEGARIATLARVVNEDPEGVEDAIRHELRTIREEYQPSVSAVSAPLTTARKSRAADSSPLPEPNHAAAMRKSPARRAVERIVDDLSDYPESLRNPLAKAQRAIYDALRSGPKTTLTLAPLTGLTSATVSTTLYTLRDKRIARGDECMPVNWSLVEQV